MRTIAPQPAATCHLCGAAALAVVPGFAALSRVTSDCRPWPPGGALVHCDTCGLMQSVTDARWHAEAQRIYQQYSIYHQSGGHEQRVFPGRAGVGFSRSGVLVDRLAAERVLPASGRLLDVGCGNGSFLRAFSERVRGWRLFGTEFDDKYKAEVESIPGVEAMLAADVAAVEGRYDLVSLVHVLEHLPAPTAVLQLLHDKLTDDGLLLIEVPDCARNPFMLLVADHCSHFSVDGLSAVVAASGFDILHASNEWVSKEVTIVARRGAVQRAGVKIPIEEGRAIAGGVEWLERTREIAQTAARQAPFGLFGTAIAATWLAQELGDAVAFFVDEDANRIGGQHLGRPILAPAAVPEHASVFVALPHPLASAVARRLEGASRHIALPPA